MLPALKSLFNIKALISFLVAVTAGLSVLIYDKVYQNTHYEIVTDAFYLKRSWNYYTVDLGERINGSARNYVYLRDILINLDKNDIVEFKMHNFGGVIQYGRIIIDGLYRTKAKTIGNLIGNNYSMGSSVACAMQKLEFSPGTFLMFHNPNTQVSDQVQVTQLISNKPESDANLDTMIAPCLEKGYITQEQVKELKENRSLEIYKQL